MTKTVKNISFLAISALVAGLINGLLGAGGGIVVVWALSRALSPCLTDRRDAFANALIIMLPISAISATIYSMRGAIDNRELDVLILPALFGGLIGALALDKINVTWLRMIFAVIIVYSGFTMLF